MEYLTPTMSNSKDYNLGTKFKAPDASMSMLNERKKIQAPAMWVTLPLILGKVEEQLILLKSISNHRKDKEVIGSHQHGFTKGFT